MRKAILAITLLSIILVAGCVETGASGPTGEVIKEIDIIEHQGSCVKNTDCLSASCSDELECHCMNAIQIETEMKCPTGRLETEKDYGKCGCMEGVCMQIIK